MDTRKYLPISVHKTLQSQLEINWQDEYNNEYHCPFCEIGQFTTFYRREHLYSKLELSCDNCKKRTRLNCQVPVYIYNYCPNLECPHPLCHQIGHNGQKGWIYKIAGKSDNCKCRFCKIIFNPYSIEIAEIKEDTTKEKTIPFSFVEDTWDLQNFYERNHQRFLYFQDFQPHWYRQIVKEYFYYLLKSKIFSSDSKVINKIGTLRQLGRIIVKQELKDKSKINRNTILHFLDSCQNNKNITINQKLTNLRDFFNWLDLDVSDLIRSRDFLKISQNDVDWLDKVTRQAIKNNLDKIPAPIACQYLVQEYLAGRPSDICQLAFDCLVEENGKWYVKFFQHKNNRWHQIIASREIRKIIEKQQLWIRKVFGKEYSYLFCHFINVNPKFYPFFPNIKPLSKPPKVNVKENQMTRIIRMLIEKENIRDSNGQKPHFTGRITRHSRLQEVRVKYGIEAARLYADHKSSTTTFQHYAPPTREQIAAVDLPFQELLMNLDNKFLPWQSLPESLLKNPKAHELDLEIAPRLVVYGHCALDPKTPCPVNLYPKCYGCSSFRPSTGKLPLYERQYQGEKQRLTDAEKAGAELASEEAKATIEAMDKWLPELRRLADG